MMTELPVDCAMQISCQDAISMMDGAVDPHHTGSISDYVLEQLLVMTGTGRQVGTQVCMSTHSRAET